MHTYNANVLNSDTFFIVSYLKFKKKIISNRGVLNIDTYVIEKGNSDP